MNRTNITTIFDYNYWANGRILAAAAQVDEALYAAPAEFPYGGLRGTLVHTLEAEHSWRMLLQHGKFADDLVEADFPSVQSLIDHWQAEENEMRQYVHSLSDEDLEAVVRYTTESGLKRERVRWHCLYHVGNHGTQHRSESAALLTRYGQSTGDLDFPIFLNELKAAQGPTAS